MKATARVIVPYTSSLKATLLGISETVSIEDVAKIGFPHPTADVSTVQKDGMIEGTILYFNHRTPHELFPHLFRREE